MLNVLVLDNKNFNIDFSNVQDAMDASRISADDVINILEFNKEYVLTTPEGEDFAVVGMPTVVGILKGTTLVLSSVIRGGNVF